MEMYTKVIQSLREPTTHSLSVTSSPCKLVEKGNRIISKLYVRAEMYRVINMYMERGRGEKRQNLSDSLAQQQG